MISVVQVFPQQRGVGCEHDDAGPGLAGAAARPRPLLSHRP